MNKFEKGLLKYFTKAQLHKIQTAKIGIAGCGGLGTNIANALARSGFIDFEIIDNDIVEGSNLNRQNYFIDEIGLNKTDVTGKRIRQINPDANIITHKIRLSKGNFNKYFRDRGIVFEAFDNKPSKKLFLEMLGNSDRLLIMGSGMAGIKGDGSIKIKKVKRNLFIVGDGITDADKKNPPLAPRVIACAALMASVALENILR